jgi:endonuclease I
MYNWFIVFVLTLTSVSLRAQFDHEEVYPGLEGDALLEALQDDYTTPDVLSFSDARDTLFSVIWGENDSLECVYTGYKRYMDPDEDPTVTVYNDGAANGINTEHSYPQSKGASDGNPKADMHHLFPTRVDVNGVRASHPFEEIPDDETATWYSGDFNTNNIPSANTIDDYSEFRSGGFEVRESFKGNIARAAFYFYTVYRDEADMADPDFFDIQKEDLCDWHFEDPVDEEEWVNTFGIAKYQGDIPNPFILDCSLARLYCPQIDIACGLVSSENIELEKTYIYPNPTTDFLNIRSSENLIEIEILGLNGKSLMIVKRTDRIDFRKLGSGVYIIRLKGTGFLESKIFVKR